MLSRNTLKCTQQSESMPVEVINVDGYERLITVNLQC